MGRLKYAFFLMALVVTAAAIVNAQAPPIPTYNDVAAIFASRCVMCHGGAKPAVDLSLDSHEGILNGSLYNLVVKAGDVEGSELIRRVKGLSTPRMPLNGPPYLADHEIALLEKWVAGGLLKGEEIAAAAPAQPAPAAPAPAGPPNYQSIAPIVGARCVKCHTDNGLMGPAPEGYRLDSYAAAIAATERARIVPGHSDASEMVRRIRGQALPRMPMDGPPYLNSAGIRLIEDWIAAGACNEAGTPAAMPVGARLRLHGTLTGNAQLDGLLIDVGPHTRIDKSPRTGDYVEVRGRLNADGGVAVERLRRR
jgi:mono/diheme cytochrome c family protein